MVFIFLFLISHCAYSKSYSLDSIFVTSKQGISQKEDLNSTYVISAETIDKNSKSNVLELLASVPGIGVSTTGVQGGESSIFIRGAEGRHTLVLIDGVKVFDPTTIGRTFNASILDIANIERIEVLKGNQSVLYGSDAIGGVINIITKIGSQNRAVKLGDGNFKYLSAGFGKESSSFSYSLQGNYKESDFDDSRLGSESDKKVFKAAQTTIIYEKNKVFSQTSLSINESFFETDKFDYTNNTITDDNFSYNKINMYQIREKIDYEIDHLWKIESAIHLMQIERNLKYESLGSYSFQNYNGKNYGIDLRLLEENEKSKTIYGIYSQTESYQDSDVKEIYLNQTDFYLKRHLSLEDNLSFEIGTRYTQNNYFENYLVYGLGMKKWWGDKYFSIGHHTGFKTPTVYQLRAKENSYGPVGNENLNPETSEDFEVAIGNLKNKYQIEVTAFYNEVDEYIDFNNGYENLYKVIYKGFEFRYQLNYKKIKWDVYSTILDLSTSGTKELARRPRQSYGSKVSWSINQNNELFINYNFFGKRFDYLGSDQVVLDKYELVDFNYSWNFKRVKLNFLIGNILNQNYEIASGYETLGRNYQVSFNYKY